MTLRSTVLGLSMLVAIGALSTALTSQTPARPRGTVERVKVHGSPDGFT